MGGVIMAMGEFGVATLEETPALGPHKQKSGILLKVIFGTIYWKFSTSLQWRGFSKGAEWGIFPLQFLLKEW